MMKKLVIISVFMASIFSGCSTKQDKLATEWEKMHKSKSQSLVKFNNSKFGMFIHFGSYSRLEGFWKGERVKGIGECIMRYSEIPRNEYREACKQFNPVKFNADEWVQAAKMTGMSYIVAMPKHADGFAMYDSKVTDYDIMDLTSFGRDPMDELYQACQRHGINFSIYFNYLDWMDGGDGGVKDYEKNHSEEDKSYQYWANTWDPSPVAFTEYFEKKYKPQLRELLEKYPGMLELWHDMPMKITREQSFSVYKMVYEIQPQILHNSRIGNDFGDFWIPGDNIIPDETIEYQLNGKKVDPEKVKDLAWETPGTMNNTWGFRSDDLDWKSTEELLYWLTSISSKGGNYLLNIGPTGEGLFPEESLTRLKDMGEWMKVNGESVYGTVKWIVNHEGPTTISVKGTESREESGFNTNITPQDFWFSKKDNNLYVTSLKWPENKEIQIESITRLTKDDISKIELVKLIGCDEIITWSMEEKGLKITLPSKKPNPYGYVLRITFKNK
jgi:alpha-L-fucosidase